MSRPEVAVALGQEQVGPDEDRVFREMAQVIQKLMNTAVHPVRRQQHPKHHGCVRATFAVDAGLPNRLKVGLFAERRTYEAWVRFSNSTHDIDRLGNAHGIAIKLLGVTGARAIPSAVGDQTQDFLLVDYPRFFVRTPQDYLALFQAIARNPKKTPWSFFLPGLNPLSWRLRELRTLKALRELHIDSVLAARYWSMSPYRFGEHAVKYFVRPANSHLKPSSSRNEAADDYLRQRLATDLRERDARFEFMVQMQTNATTMPVEDPTVEWDAPYERVATLTIPAQDISAPEHETLAEHLSFNPWHSLEVHRPLGGMNRIRRAAYEASSGLRHSLNGIEASEPRVS